MKLILVLMTLIGFQNIAQAFQKMETLTCVKVSELGSHQMTQLPYPAHNSSITSIYRAIYKGLSEAERTQLAESNLCVSAPKASLGTNRYSYSMDLNFYVPNLDHLPETRIKIRELLHADKRNEVISTMISNFEALVPGAGDVPEEAVTTKINN